MREVSISSISEFVDHIESLSYAKLWYRGVSSPDYLPIPGLIWRNLRSVESSLEHDFLISYKSYIDQQNLDPWEIYALMQHHGLPTRLLDWSESPLVALYFALSSNPEAEGPNVVWVLNPYELNRKTIGAPTLYCLAAMRSNITMEGGKQINNEVYLPPNLTTVREGWLPENPIAINATQNIRRVSSQKGCFTVHGSKDDSINEYLKNTEHFHMIRINVQSVSERKEMLNKLSFLGVDEEYIFQDLDALCRKILGKWI
ncbi:MAG: FRG domain-containing protein [Desulfobacterales bacterium]|nr:FRG domain-containing protein [Desulfobacterales bacterium]